MALLGNNESAGVQSSGMLTNLVKGSAGSNMGLGMNMLASGDGNNS